MLNLEILGRWKSWGYVDCPYIEWAALDGEWGLLSSFGKVVVWGELSELIASKNPRAFTEGWLVLESEKNPLNRKSFLRDHRYGMTMARDYGLEDD